MQMRFQGRKQIIEKLSPSRDKANKASKGPGPTPSEFVPESRSFPGLPSCESCEDTPSTDLATINITISGSIVRHIGWQPRIACKWNRSHKNDEETLRENV